MTVGFEATLKTVEILKATPTWLLTGICLSIAMVWSIPDFQGLLPSPLKPWLALGFYVSSVLLMCLLASKLVVVVVAYRIRTVERERLKHLHVYRPLRTLLLNCHITAAVGRGAPYLSHRLRNAWQELGTYRRRRTGIRKAVQALFDKQTSRSSEVEYGDDFPLSKISKLVSDNGQYADEKLLNAIHLANRSRYEEPYQDSLLTEAEYELFLRILQQGHRLSRKFD